MTASPRLQIPFDELVHQLVVPSFVIGAAGQVLVWNRACELLTGMPAAKVVGTRDHWRAYYPQPRPCLADLILNGETERIAELYAASDSSCLLYGGLHAENWCGMPLRGIELYLSIDAGPIRDAEGTIIAVVETLRDLTDWKKSEVQLRLIESVFENSSEGILITDAASHIVKVNPAYTRLTGYAPEEVIGRKPRQMQSGLHDPTFYREMWQSIHETGQWCGEIWNRRKGGEVFPEHLAINAVHDAAGKVSHYVGLFSDISDQKHTEERLEDMATHDALTGLPNRIGLSLKLHQTLSAARMHSRLVAVCFVDLDGFKPVNDTYGHEAGDRVLVEVAQRLRHVIRATDTVARIGGDEFVMLLAEFANMDEIEIALDRILDTLRKPVYVGEDKIIVSASIGVTVHPFDDADTDTLLRHADQAMYIAKNQGRNNWHMYDLADDTTNQKISSMLNRVREGLQHGEFRLYYQPKVNLRTGQIVGMEALIRWLHPERGLVPPGDFLPHVENSPLIVDLGEWVIKEAMGQIERWAADGLEMKVSVNIAARQFQHIDFVMRLRSILAQYPEVPPRLLEIEVLESTALDDVENVRAVLLACQEIGVEFALDDFGTGYSTLTYLKRLPARTLKIDQTFIRDMLEDPEDLALVEGVIGLAAVFRMNIVAEGVETRDHGIVLMRIGCDVVQGYYLARPMPAQQVPEWCAQFRPDPAWQQWATSDWDRSHLPLVLAEYDHLKWVQRLTKALDNPAIELPDEIDDHQACRFGEWYAGPGLQQYGHLAAFVEIEALHRRAHALAQALVQYRNIGQMEAARPLLDELLVSKDAIISRLAVLHDVLRAK
ncbi:MAG: EAL domain-containing protein [Rhodocyclaceae bacterium]|nr:EAL domain-containing protein [Rhodocyclaceae bacterium]MDZ4214881.1 EAL domain-containing protein [Rhodocyclaceae bacterium]